jgi:hypothetical protein
VVALAALLGASLAAGVAGTGPAVAALGHGVVADPTTAGALSAGQMRAALWLYRHTPADAVIATNVHCQPEPTRPHCDARAFWVTGLGGRRALIEGWGYTDAAVAANGRDGLGFTRQPAPDLARFELNERVFTAPSAADLETLQRRYRVGWLFADRAAGPVSPRLDQLATPRYSDATVTIYQLNGQ